MLHQTEDGRFICDRCGADVTAQVGLMGLVDADRTHSDAHERADRQALLGDALRVVRWFILETQANRRFERLIAARVQRGIALWIETGRVPREDEYSS